MSGDHLERLEAALRGARRVHHALGEPHPDAVLVDESDLSAALDELNKLRAEREGWINGASQRLRHAYRSGWDDRGERDAQALMVRGGFHEAEVRAAAYAAEWWDLGAALAAKIEAKAAPQQPAPAGGEPT